MSANVTDLLAHRADRGEPALYFPTAVDALAFAREQVRDLERLTGSALLLHAEELDRPLTQLRAVLTECIRLHAHADDHREGADRP